ncbi:hypothetical protein A0H81_10658 [Grifola frondosa]|uniref:Uncharacterized protein n=1 Tax=Grifola frondosa TaxID=5627 RepID=A0A1C7LXH5_GRIFR|nr:hypothetical protein A0H81_10658 [Grifola frondosa]
MDPLLASRGAQGTIYLAVACVEASRPESNSYVWWFWDFFSKAEITPSAMVTREVIDRPKHRARAFCAPLALIDSLPFDIPDILLDSGIVRFPLGRNTVLYRNIYRSLLNLIAADGLVVLLQMPFLFPTHHRCASHHVNPHHGVRLSCRFLSQVHAGESVFASNIAEWGTALFSLSLATNITVTTLIAVRIWWIGRQARVTLGKRHAAKHNNAIAIIRKTNAQGIVPTMIVVRVGLGISTQDASTYATSTMIAAAPERGNRLFRLPVHIRRDVEIDTGSYELDTHDGPTTSKIAFADPQDK